MRQFVVLFACVCVAYAAGLADLLRNLNVPQLATQWDGFKKAYNKNYATPEEETKRFGVYMSNAAFIEQHNADEKTDGRHGFTLEMNEFGDLTNEEFGKMYRTYKPRKVAGQHVYMKPSHVSNPDSVDWRPEGYVTGIKNQGQCGSCWAFSTTGSLEGQHFKKSGNLVSLSEQNLVDCSTAQGNEGCNGGYMDWAFEYIKSNGGIDTEASYPYTGKDGTCAFKKNNVGATITGYTDIKYEDESDLESAAATVGPIAVAIDASGLRFQFYRSGVFNNPRCSETNLDHGVLVVGYGSDSGTKYWIVKNSWGTTWGQKGYIWMSKDKNNQCGIATNASYPLV